MTDHDRPVILIAEDEPSVAEGYGLWLGDQYEIRLATNGQEALEIVDETVDVVLLDRMMPHRSGVQVLAGIRERGIDCRVAMVTAVEPDFDVIEMGFDAYITKPPDRQELLDTIEQLLDRATLNSALQEYHSLMARKGALQAQKTEEELHESAEYQELLERIEVKRAEVDEDLGDMGADIDFVSSVREIEGANDSVDDIGLGDSDAFETTGEDQ
ncbi:response regulator [Halobacterium wangiae]|uniref:response regulator n=1 Tax=Halobacterium wangiae TaxID=2902623 RepID=UPI001E5B89EB|nr:response regulator [Halobacterium wangiae]